MCSQVRILFLLWTLAILTELCYADWPSVRKFRMPLPFAVFDGPLANLVACVVCLVAVSAQIYEVNGMSAFFLLPAPPGESPDIHAAVAYACHVSLILCFFYQLIVFSTLLTYATFSGGWALEHVLT